MTAPIPPGHEGIIAHLVVGNGNEAIDFYTNAFGAEEICRMAAVDPTAPTNPIPLEPDNLRQIFDAALIGRIG